MRFGEIMILNTINVLLKIFFSVFFFKCFSRKLKKIWNFYSIVKEMNLAKLVENKKIITVLLILFDVSVPIYFILFQNLNISYLIIILAIQLFYLLEMLMPKSSSKSSNCNCYIINLPKQVTFSSIINNMLVSFCFILIFIIDNM